MESVQHCSPGTGDKSLYQVKALQSEVKQKAGGQKERGGRRSPRANLGKVGLSLWRTLGTVCRR